MAREKPGPEEGFEERITFLAYRVTAKLTMVANRLFREHGVDIYSSRILLLLGEGESRTVGDLVRVMALPQSTISHQVQRLEQQGLIARQRSSDDQRVVRITLTEAGARIAVEIEAFSRRINEDLVEALDPVERIVLPRALRSVIATLEGLE